MKKIYAEIGFGNKTFLSTEFEEDKKEIRKKGFFVPKKINDFYLRLWIGKKVFVLSTKDGFKNQLKDKNKFKFIFGIGGYEK